MKKCGLIRIKEEDRKKLNFRRIYIKTRRGPKASIASRRGGREQLGLLRKITPLSANKFNL